MMIDVIKTLREGDIYRWNYRDPNTDNSPYGSYHCCSRIAIVYRGRIHDTYWQIGQSFNGGRSFGPNELSKLELTRLGNLSELEVAKEYQADYYDDADIVDINHANSPRDNFYLRKGAKRSQNKMLAVARQRLAEAESDWHTAARRMEELRKTISSIEGGATDLYVSSWRTR